MRERAEYRISLLPWHLSVYFTGRGTHSFPTGPSSIIERRKLNSVASEFAAWRRSWPIEAAGMEHEALAA